MATMEIVIIPLRAFLLDSLSIGGNLVVHRMEGNIVRSHESNHA
jgi:hypothetical protein